jgi:hypothetical protein
MRHFIALSLLALVMAMPLHAKGDKPGTIKGILSTGVTSDNGFNIVNVGGYYTFTKRIDVGAKLGLFTDPVTSRGNTYSYTGFSFVASGLFHVNEWISPLPNLDLYGGLDLGLRFWASPDELSNRNTEAVFEPFVGATYYFKKTIGVNLELGGGADGTVNARAGLVLKF